MKILFVALMFLGFQSAFALESKLDSQSTRSTQNLVKPNHSGNRWAFLGCTHDEHECHDMAHEYGYRNSYAVHDHRTCYYGDENHACYAQ